MVMWGYRRNQNYNLENINEMNYQVDMSRAMKGCMSSEYDYATSY